MNNYDEPYMNGIININNYDTEKLLLIIIFFIGHIFLYYNIYNRYVNLTYGDDNISKFANQELLKMEVVKEQPKKPFLKVPYEEKYMEKIRIMKNEYVFTDEELEIEQQKLEEFKKEETSQKLESIYILNEKIEELNMKLFEIDNDNDQKPNNKDGSIMKKLYDSIRNEININKKKVLELQENVINFDNLKEKAQQYIIDEQLKKFKNNYVIEHTPLGNVLMFYNHDKLAFEYYSDLTIPYRYLETVARKYVLTYNYRPLYIDMNEELKEYEKKLEEKENEIRKKQEKDKLECYCNTDDKSKTKDVFAKFKSYNKEAGTGRVNTAPPPKNSIPQNRTNVNLKDNKNDGINNEKTLLKEKANRYSYQGKFLNFNILQKIDKKIVDKKYALTFAEFKKMNKIENKN
jgi:hypothetical protein